MFIEKKKGLLDYLSAQCGCTYLSDLSFKNYHIFLYHSMDEITPQDYSLEEWNDAVCYIVKEPVTFRTQADAKEYLKKWLYKEMNYLGKAIES